MNLSDAIVVGIILINIVTLHVLICNGHEILKGDLLLFDSDSVRRLISIQLRGRRWRAALFYADGATQC